MRLKLKFRVVKCKAIKLMVRIQNLNSYQLCMMHDPQSQGHIHGWMNPKKGEKEIHTFFVVIIFQLFKGHYPNKESGVTWVEGHVHHIQLQTATWGYMAPSLWPNRLSLSSSLHCWDVVSLPTLDNLYMSSNSNEVGCRIVTTKLDGVLCWGLKYC